MNPALATALENAGIDPAHFERVHADDSVLSANVPGPGAVKLWLALRDAYPHTGYWPIIRGEPDNHPSPLPPDTDPIPTGSVRELLRPRLTELFETYADGVPDWKATDDFEVAARHHDESGMSSFGGEPEPIGPWPTTPPSPELTTDSFAALGHDGCIDTTEFALVKVPSPHLAPSVLCFGGWNSCPAPAMNAAILREWNSRYGEVPAAITGDVLECVVDRPPQTEAQSLVLAAEQWVYCEDIVMQGTWSVRNLAIALWRTPTWFFWWD